jgi:hypothetical protein
MESRASAKKQMAPAASADMDVFCMDVITDGGRLYSGLAGRAVFANALK